MTNPNNSVSNTVKYGILVCFAPNSVKEQHISTLTPDQLLNKLVWPLTHATNVISYRTGNFGLIGAKYPLPPDASIIHSYPSKPGICLVFDKEAKFLNEVVSNNSLKKCKARMDLMINQLQARSEELGVELVIINNYVWEFTKASLLMNLATEVALEKIATLSYESLIALNIALADCTDTVGIDGQMYCSANTFFGIEEGSEAKIQSGSSIQVVKDGIYSCPNGSKLTITYAGQPPIVYNAVYNPMYNNEPLAPDLFAHGFDDIIKETLQLEAVKNIVNAFKVDDIFQLETFDMIEELSVRSIPLEQFLETQGNLKLPTSNLGKLGLASDEDGALVLTYDSFIEVDNNRNIVFTGNNAAKRNAVDKLNRQFKGLGQEPKSLAIPAQLDIIGLVKAMIEVSADADNNPLQDTPENRLEMAAKLTFSSDKRYSSKRNEGALDSSVIEALKSMFVKQI